MRRTIRGLGLIIVLCTLACGGPPNKAGPTPPQEADDKRGNEIVEESGDDSLVDGYDPERPIAEGEGLGAALANRNAFMNLDRDKDTFLDVEEFGRWFYGKKLASPIAVQFAHLDKDGDKRLNASEMAPLFKEWKARAQQLRDESCFTRNGVETCSEAEAW